METGTTLTVNPEWIVPDFQLELPNTVEHKVLSKSVDEEIPFSNIDIKIEHPEIFLNTSTTQESVESILPHAFENDDSNSPSNFNSGLSHICGQCSSTFATPLELKRHELTHATQEDTNQNVCKICSIEFVFREGLLKHMRFHATYTCRYFHCKEVFQSMALRKNHEQRHIVVGAAQMDKTQTLQRKRSVEKAVPKSKPGINEASAVFRSKRQKTFHVSESIITTRLRSGKVNRETTKRQDKNALQCAHCNKKFSKHSNLVQHMRLHSNEKRFQCRSCSSIFIDTTQRRRHEVSKHKDGVGRYQCDQCDVTAETPSALDSHKRKHTGERPFSCEVCDKTFTVKSHLVSHKRIHTGEKPYKCNECDEKFTDMTQRRRHEVSKHKNGVGRYQCDQCDATAETPSALHSHKREHTGERPFSCDVCGKTFTLKSHLVSHKRIHTGEKPYKCTECDQKFIDRTQRRRHEVSKHNNGVGRYQCDQCNATAETPSALDSHKSKHTGERPFSCEVCGKTFTLKSHLVSHKRIHTGEKPYKCNDCDAKFGSTTQRRRHVIMVHTIEKSFACDKCDAKFAENSGLVKHESTIHLGEKPYKCRICDMKFAGTHQRKRHERTIHTMEKPFKCRNCDAKFADTTQRKRHEIALHYEDGKPYKCKECDAEFSDTTRLREHVRRIHTGETPYKCHECDEKFAFTTQRKRHERSVHMLESERRPHLCDECGKTFEQPGLLKHHLTLHNGEKPFACDQCEVRYRRKESLRVHLRVHAGIKPFLCSYCPLKCTTRKAIKVHEMTHTKEKPYTCEICERKFAHKQSLNIHIGTHTVDKPYSCDHCNKCFQHFLSLKSHILFAHSKPEDKKFVCDTCGFRFLRPSQLKRHIITHTGVKPHKCDHCEKTFTQRSRLTQHIRIHHGHIHNINNNLSTEDKKLVCKVCGKKFTRNYDYKKHILIHSGSGEYEVSSKCDYCVLVFPNHSKLKLHIQQQHDSTTPKDKKHGCEICGKKFFRHADCKRHLVTHTGTRVTPYKCNSCEKAFTQRSRLELHIRNIHGSSSFNNLSEASENNDTTLNLQENSVVNNNSTSGVGLHSSVMMGMTTTSAANRNENEYFENEVEISNIDRRGQEGIDLQLAKSDKDKHTSGNKMLEGSVPQDWTSQNFWNVPPL